MTRRYTHVGDEPLIGQCIGWLFVAKRLRSKRYICECVCGEVTTRRYESLLAALNFGYVSSCGCRGQEATADSIREWEALQVKWHEMKKRLHDYEIEKIKDKVDDLIYNLGYAAPSPARTD